MKTEVTFAPRDIIQIDNARIAFRNFSGKESEFNRKGDRNFSWVIEDEDLYNELLSRGWNVRRREPREPDGDPFMHLPIKLKFTEFGPNVKLVRAGKPNLTLDEESVNCLDYIDIARIDLDIRPYDWVLYEGKPSEKRGRTAYLQTMYVTQLENRFDERYEGDFPVDDDEPPFDMD